MKMKKLIFYLGLIIISICYVDASAQGVISSQTRSSQSANVKPTKNQTQANKESQLRKLFEQGKSLYDEKKYDEAFPIILKAANGENPEAQCLLAEMYGAGYGVEPDSDEMLKWYKKAADNGSGEGMFNVGFQYGIDEDYAEALKWYIMASEKNFHQSYLEIGNIYKDGKGVDKDIVSAIKWYALGSENAKDGDCAYQLYEIFEEMGDTENSKKWLKKAEEDGSVYLRIINWSRDN